MVTWIEPKVFVAVMVKFARAMEAVGVPLITPVAGSSVSPCGSVGIAENDAGVPPTTFGVLLAMGACCT
jgi:hypothetical protein